MRRWWLIAAAAALAGCSPRAPDSSKESPKASLTWPARRAVPDHAGATGTITTLDAPHGLLGFRVSGTLKLAETERDALRPLLGDEGATRAIGEGDGAFVYQPRRPPSISRLRFLLYTSATPDDPPRIQRTWFAVTQPAGEPRGVALLMPGLFGTPEATLNLVTMRLRERSWIILRMMSQPSRFTERKVYQIDPARPDNVIAAMARDTDDRAAECAFAAQAALAQLEQESPPLARLPRIAVGMSGGAMTLPTVVAREPDRYTAAVMIAGGCDFFAITNETNYTLLVNAVRIQWKPEPTPDQLASIDARYLAEAPLDSYHTAAALKSLRTLMIHGDHDMAVPARLGDLLWERLGRPERWVQTAGHEEVFMRLPAQMDRLMAWIDAATTAPRAPGR